MKFISLKTIGLALAGVTLCSAASQATVIAYEGFDMGSGNIVGQQGSGGGTATWSSNTWEGTDGTWSADNTSIPDTLSYGDLITSPGQAYSTQFPGSGASPGNQQAFRQFGLQSATGTYWLGFLINRSLGTPSESMGISLFNGSTEHTFVGQAGAPPLASEAFYSFIAPFGGNFRSDDAVVSDQVFFLLVRYLMDGNFFGETSLAHYWVNPDISSMPSDASAENPGGTNFRAFEFDRIRIGSFGSQGFMDEIRIGTTFADVAPIPEPSTVVLALLGGGLLAYAARRRKTS